MKFKDLSNKEKAQAFAHGTQGASLAHRKFSKSKALSKAKK